MVNKIINFGKQTKSKIGQEFSEQVGNLPKVSVETNVTDSFGKLAKAMNRLKKAVTRDTKKFGNAIAEACKEYKKDLTQDVQDFKEEVVEIVDETEATILVNDVKVIEFKNRKISLNQKVIEKCVSDIINKAISIAFSLLMNKLNSFVPKTSFNAA